MEKVSLLKMVVCYASAALAVFPAMGAAFEPLVKKKPSLFRSAPLSETKPQGLNGGELGL